MIQHPIKPKALCDFLSSIFDNFGGQDFHIDKWYFLCVHENHLEPLIEIHCLPSIFLIKLESLCHALTSSMAGILQDLPIGCYGIASCSCGK